MSELVLLLCSSRDQSLAIYFFIFHYYKPTIFVSDISFDTVYKQQCRAVPPPTPQLQSPSGSDTNTNRQQRNNQLYCGYCDVQCMTTTDLMEHCKQDLHKYAVFADCGRSVLWQFEPPPTKEDNSADYG